MGSAKKLGLSKKTLLPIQLSIEIDGEFTATSFTEGDSITILPFGSDGPEFDPEITGEIEYELYPELLPPGYCVGLNGECNANAESPGTQLIDPDGRITLTLDLSNGTLSGPLYPGTTQKEFVIKVTATKNSFTQQKTIRITTNYFSKIIFRTTNVLLPLPDDVVIESNSASSNGQVFANIFGNIAKVAGDAGRIRFQSSANFVPGRYKVRARYAFEGEFQDSFATINFNRGGTTPGKSLVFYGTGGLNNFQFSESNSRYYLDGTPILFNIIAASDGNMSPSFNADPNAKLVIDYFEIYDWRPLDYANDPNTEYVSAIDIDIYQEVEQYFYFPGSLSSISGTKYDAFMEFHEPGEYVYRLIFGSDNNGINGYITHDSTDPPDEGSYSFTWLAENGTKTQLSVVTLNVYSGSLD